ncbi:DUF2242 domain-containing protein, partial [Streptomyces sp. SID2131]|nr:DUF2242 domain-containing protein [Streptomyces sp. SID2131]
MNSSSSSGPGRRTVARAALLGAATLLAGPAVSATARPVPLGPAGTAAVRTAPTARTVPSAPAP